MLIESFACNGCAYV